MATIDINLGLTAIAAGTVDAITATYDPAPTLFDRLTLYFVAGGANTSTTPTFNPNALGAKTIAKKNNQALVAGDIPGQYYVAHVQYNSTLEKWILLNPASDESDTIWEENGGVITPQTISNLVRLGNGNTNWGQSPLEIYSEDNGVTALFIGDIGNQFMWILQTSTTFQIVSSLPLELNADLVFASVAGIGIKLLQVNNDGEVDGSNVLPSDTTATTQSAGDNSTKVATTEYVDRVNVQSVASSATVTATAANDLVVITAQAAGLTLANPTGTWQQGQALVIRIKDNGTSRTIAYGAKFRALGTTLPTATTISKTIYLFVIYNSTDDKFDVTGVSTEA